MVKDKKAYSKIHRLTPFVTPFASADPFCTFKRSAEINMKKRYAIVFTALCLYLPFTWPLIGKSLQSDSAERWVSYYLFHPACAPSFLIANYLNLNSNVAISALQIATLVALIGLTFYLFTRGKKTALVSLILITVTMTFFSLITFGIYSR